MNKIDDLNCIILGDGWHTLEGNENLYWRWTSGLSFLKINSNKYDSISIESLESHIDINCKIYTKFKNKDVYDLYECVKVEKYKKLNIKIPITDVVDIKILMNVFIPSELDAKSTDPRKLGLKINGFSLWQENKSEFIKISKIIQEQDICCKELSHIEVRTNKFFEFPQLETKNNIDDYSILLTCHGDRTSFGKRAYQSIIESGISNITIVISGNNNEYINWAKQLSKKHNVVIIEDNKNNNLCWIEGLKNVHTNWVTILHDDDVLLPEIKNAINLLNEKSKFGVWKGSVENFITKKTEDDSTLNLNLKTGLYNTDLIKYYVLKPGYPLSPIHGVFPTKDLLKCLIEWETNHSDDNFFYENPTFVVGNDLYIWSHFTKNSNDLFLFYKEKCTKCISHEYSSTQVDINRSKEKESLFLKRYSEVKRLYIKNNLKVGVILYVHELNDSIKKCIENINNYKFSKYNIPFVLYSDNQLNGVNYIKFNKMPEMQSGLYRKCDKYAFWAFMEAIKIAKEKEWDYFFCYEWDCLIGQDYWFDTLWQEHLSWPYEPIITGTPVIRMPKIVSGNFFQGAQDYIYNYSKQCNLSMNIDQVSPTSIYTNGALTFYNTKKLCEFFANELNNNIIDKSQHVDEVGPWDLDLGIRIYNKLKDESFKRVGWLPSSYSGCGDFCYNEKQRLNMLETNLKIVMHQYKYT